jgi:hypothetical protein
MRDIAYSVASTYEEVLAPISLYDGKSLIQAAARNDADKDLLDRVTEIPFNLYNPVGLLYQGQRSR